MYSLIICQKKYLAPCRNHLILDFSSYIAKKFRQDKENKWILGAFHLRQKSGRLHWTRALFLAQAAA